MTHGGVRWYTSRWATRGWMAGTIWIADAPVPISATRSPAREWSWSQRAEWNTVPAKSASPGRSGIDGDTSAPVPRITTPALNRPSPVVITHRSAASSHDASTTSWPHRMRGSRPASAATPRR